MRRVFKMFLSLALVLAMLVPFSVIGASTVKAEGDNVYINVDNFPDENFRKCLLDKGGYTSDETGNYYTPEQIEAVTSIDCWRKDISNLEGIEFFTSLTSLDCGYNNLASLDLTKNTKLDSLFCSSNHITKLDLSNNVALETVYCTNNGLTELNLSNLINLVYLQCDSNQLTVLDISDNKALWQLYCSNNQLTELDLLNNEKIVSLNCSDNRLIELDTHNLSFLMDLNCSNNQLTELNLSKFYCIGNLDCSNNQLTSIIFGICSIDSLDCSFNKLTFLGNSFYSLDINQFEGHDQIVSGKLIYEDGQYKFDMNTITDTPYYNTPYYNTPYFTLISDNWTLDTTTGIATYSGSGCPEAIEYTYSISYDVAEEKLLYVTVELSNVQLEASLSQSSDAGETNNGDKTATPQTGDSSNIVIYLALSALAVAGAAMVVASYRLKED